MILLVDLGFLFIVFLSFMSGWKLGFIETMFSFGAWIGGALIALNLTKPVLEAMPPWIDSIPGGSILLGVVLFLISFAVIRLIGHVAGAGKDRAIDPGDKSLGALLGMVRGLFLVAVLGSLLVAFAPADGRVMRESRALPFISPMGKVVAQAAPAWLKSRIVEGWGLIGGTGPDPRVRAISAELYLYEAKAKRI